MRIDNEMQRPPRGFGVVNLGCAFSPLDLLGPDSVLEQSYRGAVASAAPWGGVPRWDFL